MVSAVAPFSFLAGVSEGTLLSREGPGRRRGTWRQGAAQPLRVAQVRLRLVQVQAGHEAAEDAAGELLQATRAHARSPLHGSEKHHRFEAKVLQQLRAHGENGVENTDDSGHDKAVLGHVVHVVKIAKCAHVALNANDKLRV